MTFEDLLRADPVAQTVASYERDAAAYIESTASFAPFPGLQREVDHFLANAQGPILDLGSGAGRDARYMRTKGHQVIASDLSAVFLRELPRTVLRVRLDARMLPFGAETVGAIWCCAMFMHIPRPEAAAALRELSRVLVPAGLAAVSVRLGVDEGYRRTGVVSGPRWFSRWDHEGLVAALREASLRPDWSNHRRLPDGAEWLTLMAAKATT